MPPSYFWLSLQLPWTVMRAFYLVLSRFPMPSCLIHLSYSSFSYSTSGWSFSWTHTHKEHTHQTKPLIDPYFLYNQSPSWMGLLQSYLPSFIFLALSFSYYFCPVLRKTRLCTFSPLYSLDSVSVCCSHLLVSLTVTHLTSDYHLYAF